MANNSCVAYNKPSCWLPVVKDSFYCATCQSRCDQDITDRLVQNIPHIPLSQIIPSFQTPEVQRTIRHNRSAILDRLLSTVYRRSSTLLTQVLELMRTPALRANVLMRIRSHTRPEMCAVVGYMIRKGLYPEWEIPNCITCVAHMIRETNNPRLPLPNVVNIRRFLEHHQLQQRIRQTLTTRLNGEEICLDFLSALVETRVLSLRLRQFPVWLNIITTTMEQIGTPPQNIQAFTQRVHQHPFLLHLTEPNRGFLKRRLAPWKEELMAKTWHPCRFMQCCLDEEEKRGWDDIPPYRIEAAPAEWNIKW
jgi:hypothetical protein